MSTKDSAITSQHNPENSPFFSIVTITFNNYDELLRTYESVKTQSYGDFEWIVINGGSKDNTQDFLAAVKMENFCYVSEKDKGIFDAMNKGIDRAKGEFITFLNSGDVFSEPGTLETIKNKFDELGRENGIDFIFGDSNEKDEAGSLFYRPSRKYWRRKMGMFTHHQAMFYKMEVINAHKITYDLKFEFAADYDFTLHFLKFSRAYLYIPVSICTFMQGGFSHLHWRRAVKQDSEIRDKYFKMSKIVLAGIYSYQYLLHSFRYKFTPVYNFLRFRGNK